MRRARLPLAIVSLLGALFAHGPPAAAQIEPRPVLEGFAFPTNLAFLPDGTLLFTEKETGSVRVVTPRGELVDRPFVTLPVVPDAERGLLGIAVHPDFPDEPWVYLYRSDAADGVNRLVRVRAEGDVAVGEPEVLLDGLSSAAGYHNGGDLAFSRDGSLFVALGEAHEPERAQDPEDIGGKIVRIADDGTVPADNPFGSGNPAWSIGHRNSFGLCIDPATGDLWETENGPDRDDEVNLIEAGGNYGWPEVTGVADDDRFRDPAAVFPKPIAVTGCAVVGGDLWFGSFDGRLWRLQAVRDPQADEPEEVASFDTGVTDVVQGPDGALYVATADAIVRIDPASASPDASTATSTVTAPASPVSPPPGPVEWGEWRTWVAATAIVLLAGALAARVAAGRRVGAAGRGRGRPGTP